MEEPESLGTRTRGAFAAGGTTTMLEGLAVELALGVAATQLPVPVYMEEPVARFVRASPGEALGAMGVLGAAFGAGTVGMRTMFVPPVLRPKEDDPRLMLDPMVMGMRVMLEEPREAEEPKEMPLDEVEPDELLRDDELLGLEGLILEPIEGLLPLELLPLELLPLELLPLELLCEALAPLEPRCA